MFQKQKKEGAVLINLTNSNKYGYFAVDVRKRGEYLVRINSLGYEPKEQSVSLTGPEKLVLFNIDVKAEDNEDTSRIIGRITNQKEQIIPLAEVILYRVTEYGGMIPVGYQKTDENGFYEFDHVPKGTYKVSSNI